MKRSHKHAIDVLFPITLFFAFSACALIVLLLAANIYQKVVSDSNISFESNTTLAYITEKIRQNDDGGTDSIYISEFDGCESLAFKQQIDNQTYTTYLYETNGELKEIFLQDGVDATAASGTTIMKIQDFDMQELSSGLFEFVCTSIDGSTDSVIVSIHSQS